MNNKLSSTFRTILSEIIISEELNINEVNKKNFLIVYNL